MYKALKEDLPQKVIYLKVEILSLKQQIVHWHIGIDWSSNNKKELRD